MHLHNDDAGDSAGDDDEVLDDVGVMGELLERDACMQALARFEHAPPAPIAKKKSKKRKVAAASASVSTSTQVRTTRVTVASSPGTGK